MGPVKGVEWDRTGTDPPVYGLFCSALEWTTSWHTLYPADRALLSSPEMCDSRIRVARGGPAWRVSPGEPRGSERLGAAQRIPVEVLPPRDMIGFRCARSARPRTQPGDFVRVVAASNDEER